MATTPPPADIAMADPPAAFSQSQGEEPKFGGFTRFEVELEFVQCLANPHYISHLATLTAPSNSTNPTNTPPIPLLSHPPFIAYLAYLQYFSQPPYLSYLMYPGPTLKNLELMQSERFRREILSPHVVEGLVREMLESTGRWVGGG